MRRVPDGEAHSLFERFVPLDLRVQCEASLVKHGSRPRGKGSRRKKLCLTGSVVLKKCMEYNGIQFLYRRKGVRHLFSTWGHVKNQRLTPQGITFLRHDPDGRARNFLRHHTSI